MLEPRPAPRQPQLPRRTYGFTRHRPDPPGWRFHLVYQHAHLEARPSGRRRRVRPGEPPARLQV